MGLWGLSVAVTSRLNMNSDITYARPHSLPLLSTGMRVYVSITFDIMFPFCITLCT